MKSLRMSISTRPEFIDDYQSIRDVNRLAFGSDGEADLVDALRESGHLRLSMVAEFDELIVGHVAFSDLTISTASGLLSALALAPMAVLPDFQNRGIGSTLVAESLRLCAEAGHSIVVVLGHPEFYSRFGFSAKRAERLSSPYSGPAFLALELVPGALDKVQGEVQYAPPFSSL